MTNTANTKRDLLKLSKGDYVYIADESNCVAKKLKSHYKGPCVVDLVCSPHMVQLAEMSRGKCLSQPVHVDRLKIAYVRHPEPLDYSGVSTRTAAKQFVDDSVQTDFATVPVTVQDKSDPDLVLPHQADHSNSDTNGCIVQESRDNLNVPPRRNVQKPLHFGDSDHVDPMTISLIANESGQVDIKRVLAQKHTDSGFQLFSPI